MGYKLKRITIRPNGTEQQIRPKVEPKELCFTANTANSTVQLTKQGSPTSVTLETSTDWKTWTAYSIWSTITLTSEWDKIYFRNTSETDTEFGWSSSNYYQFAMSWSIAASGDIGYLLNKNSTLEASSFCFYRLFMNCTSLTATPTLPATTVNQYSYNNMFKGCTSLETLPTLPATNISEYCYAYMFSGCTKIKLSATQTWDYQTAYRMPATWTWTTGTGALNQMFFGTWWTFTSNPSVNTTYYTSNTVVS